MVLNTLDVSMIIVRVLCKAIVTKIIDSHYNEVEVKPKYMKPYRDTNSNCYDLIYNGFEGRLYRQAFLYGEPGGRNCGI